MKKYAQNLVVLALLGNSSELIAQVQNDALGSYWLDPANPPANFTIGNAPVGGSALNVRGDLMGAPTGEVFRTDAPAGSNTNWRLFRGGTEYGRLSNLTGVTGFNVDATVGELWLRTIQNQPIDFRTNGTHRMRLLPNATYTIGTYTGQQKNGSLLLSPSVTNFYANGARGPFSMLHLAAGINENTQTLGYRPWMGPGMTITGNRDQGYMGLKFGALDHTDMVVAWSNDAPGENGPDRFRFLFTNQPNGSASGSQSEEGLEGMRLTAVDQRNINVGIGDFYAGNLADPPNVVEPTERLDVLDGKVRVRALPTDPTSTSNEYVTVNTTTGVLEHRPLPPAATTNCEWVPDAGANKMTTATAAVSSNVNCPEQDWRFGIGVLTPEAKVHVVHDEVASLAPVGVGVYSVMRTNSTGWHTGVETLLQPAVGASADLEHAVGMFAKVVDAGTSAPNLPSKSWAVAGESRTSSNLHLNISSGVEGFAITDAGTVSSVRGGNFKGHRYAGTVNTVYGTYSEGMDEKPGEESAADEVFGAYATGHGGKTSYGVKSVAWGGASNYSVYGESPGSGANDWSGYFAGKVTIQNDLYHNLTLHFSDGTLKTDVQDVSGARERLEGLRPRTYRLTEEAQARMGPSPGTKLGFIAQEVEQVLPELVSGTTLAAVRDTAGQEIWPAQDVKAVNYVGIIPLLVAGYQEQRSTIDALEQRLGVMEQLLAACCANPNPTPDRALPQPGTDGGLLQQAAPGQEKLNIVPNPFSERTTVHYTLDRGGRAQLLANSADGKELRVLQEASLEAGSYQYDWHTASLAAGMYYVTLLVDGVPLNKKAVKVAR